MPTRNWIFWAICLIPLLNGASLELTLAMVALGYWAFDDPVCILPVLVYVLTHAKSWARRILDRVKMKKWERQHIKKQQEWAQAHEVAEQRRLEEDRIKQAAEEARIAALPPPPTAQQIRAENIRRAEEERQQALAIINASSLPPNAKRRAVNEVERQYRKAFMNQKTLDERRQ